MKMKLTWIEYVHVMNKPVRNGSHFGFLSLSLNKTIKLDSSSSEEVLEFNLSPLLKLELIVIAAPHVPYSSILGRHDDDL
jgi:hypothetical protein